MVCQDVPANMADQAEAPQVPGGGGGTWRGQQQSMETCEQSCSSQKRGPEQEMKKRTVLGN